VIRAILRLMTRTQHVAGADAADAQRYAREDRVQVAQADPRWAGKWGTVVSVLPGDKLPIRVVIDGEDPEDPLGFAVNELVPPGADGAAG
jgi:hypothetical protein